ncbi:MAG TPA: lysylphosphatidylglycerol synthase transmembrane domain-containing protein [Candidatus Binatia bacterium]|nr:lysylphosphatidylglycerol synthase transmembrane domain-containing protein [Candidatus Binatia bacterium]
MTRPRAWLTLLGLAMSAAAVALLLRSIDAADTWRRLRAADPLWFLGACAVTTASYVVRAVRWGELLSTTARPSFRRLFSATMIGFLAINTLPARLGELVRAYALSRSERISTATVLGSVAVERLLDLAALGVFWSLSLGVASLPAWFRWSGFVTLGLTVAAAAGLLALHRFGGWRALGAENGILRRLPEKPRRALAAAIPAFGEGVRSLASPSILIRAGLLTAAMWIVTAAVFLMTGAALGMALPLWAPCLLAFIVCVGIMVPSSPGFVGVMEGACVVGLGLTGVRGPEALAYGVLYHATQLAPLVLLGTWYAVREHVGGEVLHGVPEAPPPADRKNRRH